MKVTRTSQKDRLTEAMDNYREATNRADQAAKDAALNKAIIMQELMKARKKSFIRKDGGKQYKATVVTPEDKVLIDPQVINALSDAEVLAVTDRLVNRGKLDEAMEDPAIHDKVLPFLSFKPSTPYLRFSEGVNDDFE